MTCTKTAYRIASTSPINAARSGPKRIAISGPMSPNSRISATVVQAGASRSGKSRSSVETELASTSTPNMKSSPLTEVG